MLRKLSAALLAAALLAGPAFAADSSSNTDTKSAATSHHATAKPVHKASKKVEHVRKHVRRQVVRHITGKTKIARASKTRRMHRHHLALHKAKPAASGKTNKASKLTKPNASTHS